MSNSFLPDDYKLPKGDSAYLKFQEGENKFRILSAPILGFEDWENKKPVRFRMDNKPKQSIDPSKPVKHFWAMICWDYSSGSIKIVQITQATIQKTIQTLQADPDWGSPVEYDLKVTKKTVGDRTEYNVTPSPKKPITQEMIDAFARKKCDLEMLFDGLDPFKPGLTVTPMAAPF